MTGRDLEAERVAVRAELAVIAGSATADATLMLADRAVLALRSALVRAGLGDRLAEVVNLFADELAAPRAEAR